MEDAMILNKSAVERGLAHATLYKTETLDLHEERGEPSALTLSCALVLACPLCRALPVLWAELHGNSCVFTALKSAAVICCDSEASSFLVHIFSVQVALFKLLHIAGRGMHSAR